MGVLLRVYTMYVLCIHILPAVAKGVRVSGTYLKYIYMYSTPKTIQQRDDGCQQIGPRRR